LLRRLRSGTYCRRHRHRDRQPHHAALLGTFIKALADPGDATAMLEMAKNPVYIGLNALTTALVTPVFPILAFIMYFSNNEENPAVLVTTEDDNKVKVEDLYPKMPDNN
jgi:hypothetical protein